MSARRRREYQQELLAQLKLKTFEYLAALPARKRVETPAELRGWKFFVCSQPGEQQGVQIIVEARKRSLLIFESVYSPSFEMLPDGTVLEETIVADD